MIGNHFTKQEKLRVVIITWHDWLFLFQIILPISNTFMGQPLQVLCSSRKLNLLSKKEPKENPLNDTLDVTKLFRIISH